jgi:hypothetical protein
MPELVAAGRCAVAVEICSGLRKLESASPAGTSGENSQVSVEFARKEPLPSGESVHIPLGMRDGRLRVLIGVPRLVGKKGPTPSVQDEYLYRITGLISELHPDRK